MKIKNYIIGLSIIVSSIIISISMVVANKSSNKNKIEEIIKLEECGSKGYKEYTSKNYYKEHSWIINLKDKVVRHIEVTDDGEILHPLYHITDITDDRVFTNDKFEFLIKRDNFEISTSINFKTGNVIQIYKNYQNDESRTEYFCEIKKNQSKRPLTKLVKFKIGFSLKVPIDYIQLNSDKNLNKILDDHKGKEVDKNYLEKMLSMLNQNPTYDYFINSNFSPDSNSLNFNYILDGGSTINNYRKLGFQETCSLLQNQISQIYNQNKEQFFCSYLSTMNKKLGDVLKIIHEGRLPNQKMIQYQFQYEDKLVSVTLACKEENCDIMDQELVEILNSIQ